MDYKQKYENLIEKLKKAKEEHGGYTFSSVVDNIVPELCESDDERIRKSLIELVRQSSEILSKQNQESMIAWLEKQRKNQDQNNKIYIQKFNIGDTVCRQFYEDHTIEKIYNDGKFEPVYICKNEEGLESHISFLEQDEWKLKDRVQLQSKQEWSEENEAILNDIITAFKRIGENCEHYISPDTAKVFEKTLKSLKDRVQPQPKQEWSEEDERILNAIINDIQERHPEAMWKINCGSIVAVSTKYIIDWLKSIKPNHWKPSKEQMEMESSNYYNRYDSDELYSRY